MTSKSQSKDISRELKKEIIAKTYLWRKTEDSEKALEINMEAKLDEAVYYKRCMQKKVILYDIKHHEFKEIKYLRERENICAIGVTNAAKGVCAKKRASFEESKW